MPGRKRKREKRVVDRERIAELRLKSWTQQMIAREMGLSRATVVRELRVLTDEWKRAAAADIAAAKARDLQALETLEREAWAEWERSKLDYARHVQQQGGEGGGYNRTETGGRLGDPKYLQIAINAHERRARLLGLDAPAKVAATNPDGSALSKEHRDAIVAAAMGGAAPAGR
jgi:hypothetical protein